MSRERFQKVRELFDAALDVAADTRVDWCRQACGDDAELLQELLRLLGHDAERSASKTVSAVSVMAAALEADSVRQFTGARAGAYTLTEEIGQGGMGRVFRAVREQDGVRQEVAVKLLRREMIDTALLARFQAERRILAGLNHPGIARLLDFGETADGIPFVAMELVRGESIVSHCTKLGLRDRLLLFRQVLDAVAHAHRNLIVHRDIKPANVLVDAAGHVKLLDFGIAKPLQAQADATATHLRYLTPNYAAPEQFGSGPVSVMCDVYALGALLYELLSGRPPLQLDGLSAAEIEKQVLQHPPEALERAAGQGERAAAALGSNDLGAWRKALRGDLDAIVHKALRKEPEQRYLSIEAFDADLQNYLDRRPVQASGNRRAYRIGKFIQRNRVLLAVVATAVLAVSAALAAALRQASVAAAERDSARAAVAVLSGSFRAADPMTVSAGRISATEILAAAGRQTAELQSTQPAVHAALIAEIGESELALGISALADSEIDAALNWAKGADPTLLERLRLLNVRRKVGAGLIDQADQELTELEAAGNPSVRLLLARTYQLVVARRIPEAIAAGQRAERAAMVNPGSADHAEAIWQLAEAQRVAEDVDASVATLDRLLAVYGAKNDHPRALLTRLRKVRNLRSADRADESMRDETAALLAALGQHYAPTSRVMGLAYSQHALALEAVGDVAGAIVAHEQSLAALEASLGATHRNVLMARFNVADQLSEQKSARARAVFDRTLEDVARAGQINAPLGVFLRMQYTSRLVEWKDLAAARRVLLPEGFAPDLNQLHPENRTALAELLNQLFGPLDCTQPKHHSDAARAAAIACAAGLGSAPPKER